MIVSSSYKTDIPAFYGRWFLKRLAAGYCLVVNPYGRQTFRVDLTPSAVDGFVFWTRNAAPFAEALETVAARGAPFVVQFTISGYPRALERSVIEAERAVAQARDLARRFGPRAVVWRYDPIVITTLTPPDWHVATVAALAWSLKGAVDEMVVSFMQPYRKTARNLDAAARAGGFGWRDPEAEERRDLVARLAAVAAGEGVRLTACTQPGLVDVAGVAPARCVDAGRLSDVAGRPVKARAKGNRPGCDCAESRDIGEYDTCPHGCVYCYAVNSRALAHRRHREHDPDGEFLFAPPWAGAL